MLFCHESQARGDMKDNSLLLVTLLLVIVGFPTGLIWMPLASHNNSVQAATDTVTVSTTTHPQHTAPQNTHTMVDGGGISGDRGFTTYHYNYIQLCRQQHL